MHTHTHTHTHTHREEVGVLAAHTTGWMRGLTTVRAHYAALCNEMDTQRHVSADDMSLVGTRICAFNKRQFARGYIVDKHYGEGSDDPLWPIGPGRPHTDEAIALLFVCTRCSYTPNIRTHPNYLPPYTHAPNRRTVRTRLRRASLRRMLRPRCKRTLTHPTHTNLQQASQPQAHAYVHLSRPTRRSLRRRPSNTKSRRRRHPPR